MASIEGGPRGARDQGAAGSVADPQARAVLDRWWFAYAMPSCPS